MTRQRSSTNSQASLFSETAPEASTNQAPTESSASQANESTATNRPFQSLAELLQQHQAPETNQYVSREFQAFGCHLAEQLEDTKHTALYIKLAKTVPRGLLAQALSFVSDAQDVKSKAKLFMWKLTQLRQQQSTPAKKAKVK